MESLIGKSLSHYSVLEQIGEGGMAIVYKAYDDHLEREVAIKIIRRSAFPPEQLDHLLKRFEREAKSLARMSHPNIVKVLDYGEYGDSPYLVLEYLPGGTLKQKFGKPMPWKEAARLLLPVARALQFTHAQGIIHRDVKPTNILLTQSGDPMLTDFGIAKLLESGDAQTLTGTGIGIGTPEYMAPEQWAGKVGPQTDIYALGVVFYELLTEHKPYTADTPAEILLKQANEPLPRPKVFVPDLPDEVEHTLDEALAKNPADRYASMEEFALALEELLGRTPNVQTVPIQQAAPEAVEPEGTRINPLPERTAIAAKTPRPRPTISWKLWGLVAGIVVLLGIGLVLGPRMFKMASPGAAPTVMPTDTSIPVRSATSRPTLTPSPTETPNITSTSLPTATATPLLRLGQSLASQPVSRSYGLWGIVFSPDGRTIGSVSSYSVAPGSYFVTFAADTLKEIQSSFFNPINRLIGILSPSGQFSAWSFSNGTVQLLVGTDRNQQKTLPGHGSRISQLAFSADTTLAVAYEDRTISLWRVSDGSLQQTLQGIPSVVNDLAFSPDGQILVTGSQDQTTRLWQVSDGSLLRSLPGSSYPPSCTFFNACIVFSPDGQMLADAPQDGTIRLWRVSDGSLLQTLKGHTRVVSSMDFSPDGQTLASGSGDMTVRLWRVSDGSLLQTLKGHTGAITAVAFSPDGSLVASVSRDTTMRLWGVFP